MVTASLLKGAALRGLLKEAQLTEDISTEDFQKHAGYWHTVPLSGPLSGSTKWVLGRAKYPALVRPHSNIFSLGEDVLGLRAKYYNKYLEALNAGESRAWHARYLDNLSINGDPRNGFNLPTSTLPPTEVLNAVKPRQRGYFDWLLPRYSAYLSPAEAKVQRLQDISLLGIGGAGAAAVSANTVAAYKANRQNHEDWLAKVKANSRGIDAEPRSLVPPVKELPQQTQPQQTQPQQTQQHPGLVNGLKEYLQQRHTTTGGLVGAGLGGLTGYLSGRNKEDPKKDHSVRNGILGALAGLPIGAMIGHKV